MHLFGWRLETFTTKDVVNELTDLSFPFSDTIYSHEHELTWPEIFPTADSNKVSLEYVLLTSRIKTEQGIICKRFL